MEDKRLLEHAKGYIDLMAEGKNPLTGEDEPDDSCLQQTRISRCLRYVSGILEQVLNGELVPPSEIPAVPAAAPAKKIPFTLTEEELSEVTPDNKQLSLSRFLDRIYQFGHTENMKKPPFKQVVNWLVEQGVLEIQNDKTVPTALGMEIGIQWVDLGIYSSYYYSPAAQQWIIDRLPELLAYLEGHTAAKKVKIDPETGEILSPGGKAPFSLTEEQLDEIPVIPGGVSISRLVAAINQLIDSAHMSKLKREQVTGWLTEEGYLFVYDGGTRPSLRPTPKGEDLGIQWERRDGPSGYYWGAFYYDEAQLFILEHLQEMTADR